MMKGEHHAYTHPKSLLRVNFSIWISKESLRLGFIKQKKVGRQIIIVSHNANLVVSTDSENIVVANQKGQESSEGSQFYKFAYVNGAIECSYVDESKKEVLSQKGIREHVCEILEGGKEAFEKRENKYGFRVQ